MHLGAVFEQKFDNLGLAAEGRDLQWRHARTVGFIVHPGAVCKQKFDHGCVPGKTILFIFSSIVRSEFRNLFEQFGKFTLAGKGRGMQRRQAVFISGSHLRAVLKQQLDEITSRPGANQTEAEVIALLAQAIEKQEIQTALLSHSVTENLIPDFNSINMKNISELDSIWEDLAEDDRYTAL